MIFKILDIFAAHHLTRKRMTFRRNIFQIAVIHFLLASVTLGNFLCIFCGYYSFCFISGLVKLMFLKYQTLKNNNTDSYIGNKMQGCEGNIPVLETWLNYT